MANNSCNNGNNKKQKQNQYVLQTKHKQHNDTKNIEDKKKQKNKN